ncbi:hypothetical protein CONLIGDRAFT_699808 [Coniochaeta ligniaria NRRL 30616]|uniref:Uncharacterized protein n=1 Tax=Coniochaeta ligniaria NRRL 30616 TaxID=1408157 RepID=A0A1J7I424_9PEZI|nr:hypothetical protein CONLIGDRAFT_699808 [Coniochaeta ligniaria NRRL 30616]
MAYAAVGQPGISNSYAPTRRRRRVFHRSPKGSQARRISREPIEDNVDRGYLYELGFQVNLNSILNYVELDVGYYVPNRVGSGGQQLNNNNNPSHRPLDDATKDQYRRQLRVWTAYAHRNVPGARTDRMQDMKLFVEFLGCTMKTRGKRRSGLRPKAPSTGSVRCVMRRFCRASRWTLREVPKDIRLSMAHALPDTVADVLNFTEGELADKIGLVKCKRRETTKEEKTYLTHENYVYMMERLWDNDFHHYKHEGYRVDNGGYRVNNGGYRVDNGGYRVDNGGYRVNNSGYRVDNGNLLNTYTALPQRD